MESHSFAFFSRKTHEHEKKNTLPKKIYVKVKQKELPWRIAQKDGGALMKLKGNGVAGSRGKKLAGRKKGNGRMGCPRDVVWLCMLLRVVSIYKLAGCKHWIR